MSKKFLLVCQILFVLLTNGSKKTLKNPYPCPICEEESQIFYVQGNSDYCTLCTVRYISCNFMTLDPRAIQFYLIDIIAEKRELNKQKVYVNEVVKLNDVQFLTDLCRNGKEEITIKIFQTLNDMLKKRNIHKSLLFKQKKCALCSQMSFNKIPRSDCICGNQICFPCNRKYMKENIKCDVCNKCTAIPEKKITTRQERVVNFGKAVERTIKNFNKELRKYFSNGVHKKVILSEVEVELEHFDWTNILSPQDSMEKYWKKQQNSYVKIENFLTIIILAYIFFDMKKFTLFNLMWFPLHKITFNICFVIKEAFFAKLTSVHKNGIYRKVEIEVKNWEKFLLMANYTMITHFYFRGEGFDFINPDIIVYGILAFPLYSIWVLCLMYLAKRKSFQVEYLNFL